MRTCPGFVLNSSTFVSYCVLARERRTTNDDDGSFPWQQSGVKYFLKKSQIIVHQKQGQEDKKSCQTTGNLDCMAGAATIVDASFRDKLRANRDNSYQHNFTPRRSRDAEHCRLQGELIMRKGPLEPILVARFIVAMMNTATMQDRNKTMVAMS